MTRLLKLLASHKKKRRVSPPRLHSMTTEGEGLLLLLVLLLAAERLQLGEHGIDVEIVAGPLRGFVLVLLGGFGGRQQGGAAIGRVDRLFLGRARPRNRVRSASRGRG